MSEESAEVLGRHGNIAVVQLAGRAFPAIAIQGDTLHIAASQVATVLREFETTHPRSDAIEDLKEVLQLLQTCLNYYESELSKRGLRLPYFK
jgi:predicted component of type VI protein secretion system